MSHLFISGLFTVPKRNIYVKTAASWWINTGLQPFFVISEGKM